MKNRRAFNNIDFNKIHLTFPNGNFISTIWGAGSYSDNYDIFSYEDTVKLFETFMDSNTCEVMIRCPKKLLKKIHKKYNGDGAVIGRLGINQWVDIIKLLSK